MKKQMSVHQLANMFDHTLLKPYAQREDFERLCQESKDYG